MAAASGVRAGRAYVELATRDEKFRKGLDAAQARLQAFGAGVSAVGASLFAAGAAGVAAFGAAAKVFSDQGDAIAKTAKRTGLTAEAVSELGYAADLSGTDMAALETGVRKMQQTLADAAAGSQEAQKALDGLGLSAEQLIGLAPDQQLEVLADALAAIQNPAKRTAAALDVFGESGAQFIPMLADGSGGLRAMRAEAARLGLTVSGKTAAQAEVLNDSIGRLQKTLTKIVFEVGAAVAPVFSDLADRAAIVAAGVIAWVQANQPLIVSALKVAAVVAAVGAALVVAGAAIVGVGAVLGGLSAIIGAVVAAFGAMASVVGFLLSPIGLVVAAVVGAVAAFLYFSGAGADALDYLSGVFGDLSGVVSDTLGGIGDALMAGNIELAVQILWNSIRAVFYKGTSEVEKIWINWVNDLAGAFTVLEGQIRMFLNDLNAIVRTMALVVPALQAFTAIDFNGPDAAAKNKAIQDEVAARIGAIETFRDAEIKAAEQSSKDARARLAESIDLAKKEREAKDKARGFNIPSRPGAPVFEMADLPANAMEQVRARVSAAVGFSTSNLSGLGVGDDTGSRTATATEQTAKSAKALETFIKNNTGPIVFA